MVQRARQSFALRAALAVALLFGFYALGAAIIAVCIGSIWLQVAAGNIFPKLVLIAVVIAGSVLYGMGRSLFMTGHKLDPPGPEITAEDEPALFELIRDVAARMDTKMPAAVYLMPDVNAFVSEVGGFFGFGTRRIMGIGVGLLQVDTVQQLRGTLAHEFGHFAGGDTRLGAFLYRTRSSLAHVIHTLGRGVTSSIFISYFKMFLRVTKKISRAQELAADEASVRIAGTRAHIEGLRRVSRAGIMFDVFLRNDVTPLAKAGYKPKELYLGFRRASKALHKSGLKKRLDASLAKAETDEYDTHPALPERIEYAEALPLVEMESDDRLARTLLADPAEIERRVGMALIGKVFDTSKLESIAWKDAGARVFGPRLDGEAEERRAQLQKAGIAADDFLQAAESALVALDGKGLVAWVKRFEPTIVAINLSDQITVARNITARLVAVWMGAALVKRGATWEADPGKEIEVKEGETLHPIFAWASEAIDDAVARARLADRVRSMRGDVP